MSDLFEEFSINNLVLKNRFIMSAAADHLDDDPAAKIKRFSRLAQGNIGLIISGGTRLKNIKKWQDVIKAVHRNGGKIAIQFVAISGPGKSLIGPGEDLDMIAVSELSKDHEYFQAMAPFTGYGRHHTATEKELEDLINIYAEGARLIREIGADAVQIHAAHQNFLSQMLSPLTNMRDDKWGGSISNRCRLHREIFNGIRKEAGDDFPILIKLGVQDAIEGGLQFEEGKKVAKIIAECGYDAIEISQGLQDYSNWDTTPMRINITKPEQEAYFEKWCREIKQSIAKPTILTGGMRSLDLMEQAVRQGFTDCIGMCRPFVREPALLKRWQGGDKGRAKCISCNKCLTELFLKGQPLECYLDKIANTVTTVT